MYIKNQILSFALSHAHFLDHNYFRGQLDALRRHPNRKDKVELQIALASTYHGEAFSCASKSFAMFLSFVTYELK